MQNIAKNKRVETTNLAASNIQMTFGKLVNQCPAALVSSFLGFKNQSTALYPAQTFFRF